MRKEKCFPWIKPKTALLMLLHGRFLHGGRILCLIPFHVSRQSSLGALYSVEAITSIVYGMTLPDPYNTEMNEKLAVANEQMQAIIARLSSAANA